MSWVPLKTGDKIDIIAPSRGVSEAEVEQVKEYVTALGLEPVIPRNLLGEDLFCSNSDAFRAEHLVDALSNKDTKAVWCLRGGYGAARLLPFLEKVTPPEQQKLLIGFSDITALHIFLNQRWNWPSLHAPVLWQIIQNHISDGSLNYLNALIFGQSEEATFSRLTVLGRAEAEEERPALEITGRVLGGNLATIQSLLGTPWQLEASGAILLLEDTDERPYRLDRMFNQLHQSGVLDAAAAVLLGTFTLHEEEEKGLTQAVLERFATALSIPVVASEEIGHGATNDPVPLGTMATLTLGLKPSLSIPVR